MNNIMSLDRNKYNIQSRNREIDKAIRYNMVIYR